MPSLSRRVGHVVVAGLLLAAAGVVPDRTNAREGREGPGSPPDSRKVAALIEQLGDEDVAVRKTAEKNLTEIGEPALGMLRKAIREHADPDVRLRAILLVRAIEKIAFGELRRYSGHNGHLRALAVSRDGKRALTGSMDGTSRLWDLGSGKELARFTLTGEGHWAWSVAFSPDEQRGLTSTALDRTLRLWNLADGKEVRRFEGHTSWVYGAAYSPDGKYVASSGAGKDGDYSVRLFDAQTGKQVRKLDGHTGYVWRVQFSPDGKKIASIGSNDQTYRIWDTESGKSLVVGNNAHDGNVVGLSFSPDGKLLLTCGRDTSSKLWDVETGRLVRTFGGLADHPEAVAFSPDGKRFLVSEGKRVAVFDIETGKIVHRFEGHTDTVLAVAWLPDGRLALSGGADNVLRLWGVPP